nr:retrovirus-related Pol polyprotein from transposon TNT 1-94 [Tanacetum cinerariifolium]
MRPFGSPVTILNTLDPLGKFDGKADEGFFIGYSVNSKACRVFNSRTMIVEETLHITFLENKPNIAWSGPTWLFDIDTLIKFMNYKLVVAGNQSNGSAGKARVETLPHKDYILLPLWTQDPLLSSYSRDSSEPRVNQKKDANVNNTNNTNTVNPSANVAIIKDNVVDKDIVYGCADDPNMPNLEEINYSNDDEDVGAEADMTNSYSNIPVSTNSNDFAGKGASFDAALDSHNKDKHGSFQASKSDNKKRPNAESSTKTINTDGPFNTTTPAYADYPNDPLMPDLEDAGIFDDAYDDRDEDVEANYNNLGIVISVSPIPSTRIHKDHPKEHIFGEAKVNTTGLTYCCQVTIGVTTAKNEIVHGERGDIVEMVATTTASLDAEQDSGIINSTQSTAIPNEPIPQRTGSGGSPRRQNTILGDKLAQTRFEMLSKQSHKPPLLRVNMLRSREDSMQLMELMALCIALFDRVLALENKKTAQDLEITHLKKRFKRLKKKRKSRTPQIKRRLFKVRIESFAKKKTQGSALVTTTGVYVSTVEPSTPPPTTTTLIEDKDLTISQTLMKIRSVKSKEKSKEKGVSSTRLTRGVIIKEASETASRPIDNTQAMMEADYELAQRLQAEEQGELTIKEISKLFVELMDKRKKHFAKLRAEEIRRKPPTKAQKRNQMYWKAVEKKQLVRREQKKNLIKKVLRGTRKYWKIIRVGNHTEVHHFFDDMLKAFDRDNLVMLEGNKHLHAGRERVSIVMRNSYINAGSDSKSLSPSSLSDRMQPSGGYHVVPPPITGTFMPLKPDLVFHTATIAVETDHSAFTVKLSSSEP